ncbi:hypothetical protein MTO96_032352 [Rhipicephalus appendiculatus]
MRIGDEKRSQPPEPPPPVLLGLLAAIALAQPREPPKSFQSRYSASSLGQEDGFARGTGVKQTLRRREPTSVRRKSAAKEGGYLQRAFRFGSPLLVTSEATSGRAVSGKRSHYISASASRKYSEHPTEPTQKMS